MRKSLNLLAAAALLAALGACGSQPADDNRALNEAGAMLDDDTMGNMVVDTTADDQSVNVEDVAEENEAAAAPAGNSGNGQ